jgi:hypothetical protein
MANSFIAFFTGVLFVVPFALAHSDQTCKKDADCTSDSTCIGWFVYGQFTGKCGARGSEVDGGKCSRDLECKSGHCLVGRCYSRGKECSGGILKPGCDFEITVDKSEEGDKLGIATSIPTLVILRITGGLIEKWNTEHPEKQVKVSDRIVSVNGSPFWAEDVFEELKKQSMMKITLVAGDGLSQISTTKEGGKGIAHDNEDGEAKTQDDSTTMHADEDGMHQEGKFLKAKVKLFSVVRNGGTLPSCVAFLLLGACGLLASGLFLVYRRRRQEPRALIRVDADLDTEAFIE